MKYTLLLNSSMSPLIAATVGATMHSRKPQTSVVFSLTNWFPFLAIPSLKPLYKQSLYCLLDLVMERIVSKGRSHLIL